jgi:hypothetical protein
LPPNPELTVNVLNKKKIQVYSKYLEVLKEWGSRVPLCFSTGDDEEALLSDGESSGSSNGKSWYANAQNDYCPSLSKKQRIFGFVTCLGLGLFFFSFATL